MQGGVCPYFSVLFPIVDKSRADFFLYSYVRYGEFVRQGVK